MIEVKAHLTERFIQESSRRFLRMTEQGKRSCTYVIPLSSFIDCETFFLLWAKYELTIHRSKYLEGGRKMNKKLLGLLSGCALSAMLLTGCGNDDNNDNNGNNNGNNGNNTGVEDNVDDNTGVEDNVDDNGTLENDVNDVTDGVENGVNDAVDDVEDTLDDSNNNTDNNTNNNDMNRNNTNENTNNDNATNK